MALWIPIVQSYSERILTDPDDRLLALQGIATVLAQKWGDQYIFGLWRKILPELLVWYIYSGQVPGYRTIPGRAPSWSWGAVDGTVQFLADSYSELSFKVKDCVFDADQLSTVNRLRTLPCLLLETKIMPRELFLLTMSEGGSVSDEWDTGEPAEPVEPRLSIFYALLVLGSDNTLYTNSYALIVQLRQDGTYSRIGLARIDIESHINSKIWGDCNVEEIKVV
jgi:hypothetical protein